MLFFIEYVFMYSKLSQLSVHLEPNMIRSVNPFQHTWFVIVHHPPIRLGLKHISIEKKTYVDYVYSYTNITQLHGA